MLHVNSTATDVLGRRMDRQVSHDQDTIYFWSSRALMVFSGSIIMIVKYENNLVMGEVKPFQVYGQTSPDRTGIFQKLLV